MSCNTGFHHRCGGCSCTCHVQAPFDWSGTGQFDDLLMEADKQEFEEYGPL
jgi:hypothetical protein